MRRYAIALAGAGMALIMASGTASAAPQSAAPMTMLQTLSDSATGNLTEIRHRHWHRPRCQWVRRCYWNNWGVRRCRVVRRCW